MRKRFIKITAIMMAVMVIFSLFPTLPFSVAAAEVETEEVGADVETEKVGASKTQAEAIQWIKDRGNEGWWQDVDGAYGCQCVDLIMAYYQFLGYSRMSGNAGDYVSGHIPSGSDWYYSGTPVPGSIFVRGYDNGYYPYGHVGLVYAVDGSTMYTIETNVVSPYDGGSNASARYREHSVSFATTFINPTFKNIVPPSNPWISASTNKIPTGGSISFNFGADNATNYWIGIDRNGSRIITEESWSGKSYTFYDDGDYSAYITAYNSAGGVDSGRVYFSVMPQGHVMSQAEGAGQTIPDGDYWICSRIAQNYFLDIAGNNYNTVSGENLKTWIWDSAKTPGKWDAFHFKYLNNGFYQITQYNTNMAIDVDGASLYCGTNVQMWEKNSSNAQQWSIEKTDRGYKLRSKANNYYLDVNGARHENDTNIQVWTSNDTDAQFFGLIPYAPDERPIKDGIYTIKSQVSDTCYLDADGISGTFVNGSNIQLWNCSDGDEQFKIEYEGNGYYRIYEVSTNLPLEIINLPNEYLNKNENAMLYEKTESRGQLWKIKKNSDGTYFFVNQLNGYYLDVCDGLTANTTNVHAHPYNGSNAQKWKPRRILSDDMVTVKDVVTNSDETSVSPSVTVKVDNSAINSRFYTVKTTTDIANGTGTVTVTGKDDFCGSVTKSFKITINDTTVINDWLQNHYNTEKGDIITYYMKLNPPFPVNHLSGTFYFSEDVLEPIITPYSRYHAPSFDHADFHRMGGGQIRFDLYASQPVTLNNDIVVRMQFRVIKNGGESWLGNDFDDAQFSWDNLIQYGMEPHILTNQKLFVLGDTNGDGTVNICDVTALQRHLADLTTLTDSELAAADANGDGVVDINDATYLQMYLAEYNVALGKQS